MSDRDRRLLPLLSTPHPSGRSAMTCIYRCGNACAHPAPNESDNEYFGDIVDGVLSRRGALRAGVIGAAAIGAGVTLTASPASAAPPGARPPRPSHGRLTFKPITPDTGDRIVVPQNYEQAVVVRWGDPVLPGAPKFDFDNQTAEAQSEQFGYNCDFLMVVPLSKNRALLWANHEYTTEQLMFRGYEGGDKAKEEWIKIAMEAHGGSVVEIKRKGRSGPWKLVTRGRRRYNRRVTAHTSMRFTGPAAGGDLLKTDASPSGTRVRGMLNNCAGGVTPWGTILSGEENFNQYFVGANKVPEKLKAAYKRYGFDVDNAIPRDGSRRFDRIEQRFDLSKHPNEGHRFGWVVEIDPYDPGATPRKHTSLGRVKHEGATITIAKDGRAVAYMGDDERFEYVYKFVSKRKYRPGARSHNMKLLEEGTLYVAKFTGDSPKEEIDGSGKLPSDGKFDGTGEWIKLASGDKSYVVGMTAEEVYVFTRLAADKAGATKMDRPEDVESNPASGAVYVALTNNDKRAPGQADEANPRAANKHGQILEIVEKRNDAAASTFAWSLPLVCGDPKDPSTYFAGFDKTKVSPISCPDNVAFDKPGNLWISTDGNKLGTNDGLYAMPVKGKERGYLRQFLSVPVGAETCGPVITKDQRNVFVAVQHPGEVDGATPDKPASVWPDGPGTQPRPSVVTVWHKKGRPIGT